MLTAQTLYRTTLVAAALAAASLVAPSAANAHERGWREHGSERHWQPVEAPREFRPRHGLPFRPWLETRRICADREYRPVILTAPSARVGLEPPGYWVRATL
jgi:hypothetical protein